VTPCTEASEGRVRDEAFAAFVAKKTAAAVQAAPARYVTTVHAHPDRSFRPVATRWSNSTFGGPFYVREADDPALPTCSLVFVRSANGNTVAKDPASLGGGATDYHVIYEGLSRVLADAVLAGAATVRGGTAICSVWHPEMVKLRQRSGLARHATQIVATMDGVDLDRGILFNTPDLPVIILTGSAGATKMATGLAARPWIRSILLTDQSLTGPTDLVRAFADLRAHGIHRISCVGGRSLARDLLALKLIDDVYLTTSARDGGEPGTPLPAEAFDGELVVRKRGTCEDAGVIFEHLDLRKRRLRASGAH
jgi:riboflavin biosynthesis pyrimidine reductase